EEQMDKPAVWVGVDVSKEQLEVALRPSGEHFSLPNDARALRTLVKRLLPLKCARIVVEATGGFGKLVVAAIQGGPAPRVVVNPPWGGPFSESGGAMAKHC